jgi:expansin (peptidoglycan-binding protein)
MRPLALALLLTVACHSAADSPPSGGSAPGPAVFLGEPQSGEGTYYDADGSGNCMFDKSPGDLDVAAMNAAQYAGSALCGACAHVTGPKGEVTVRIVDQCPGCKKGDLDLHPQAFDKIGEHSAGRIPITWNLVACAVTGNVSYRYKEGSSQWWTAIQVRNHRLPITKLELRKNGAWGAIQREPYNYFVDAGGAGPGPVTVRITALDGQTLEDSIAPASSGSVVSGAAQFR